MTKIRQATKELLHENRTRIAVVSGVVSLTGFAYLYGKTQGNVNVQVLLQTAEGTIPLPLAQ